MPVFGPIATDRKVRRFGVFDLEWVPGEALPAPENLDVITQAEHLRRHHQQMLSARRKRHGY